MKGELKSTGTWETKLTQAGQARVTDNASEEEVAELKNAAWADLLRSDKLGYLALLRNLRNIVEQAPDVLPLALKQLTDRERIASNKVFPFQYQTAADELTKLASGLSNMYARQVLTALSKAVDIAVENCPTFDGQTCVCLDESGSMQGDHIKRGSLFAAVLFKQGADIISFANTARYRNFNPTDSTLSIASALQKDFVGAGTDFKCPFLIMNKPYDRIIWISDMQGWIGHTAPTFLLDTYAKAAEKRPKIYSLDLAGYGTLQFPQSGVYAIAGFSAKIFDLMKVLEQDREALLRRIRAIEL